MNPGYHDMDSLLVKYLLEEATEAERAAVDAWIGGQEANRRHFEQLKTLWQQSRPSGARRPLDEDAAWQRMKARLQPAPPPAMKGRMAPGWWKAAAILLLVVGSALLAFFLRREAPVAQLAVQSQKEVLHQTLPDGSEVTLNKNSRLRYPEKFKGDTRSVALEGEAFFEITPDRKKPFVITVNEVTVRVVGTTFNIRARNGLTEVVVETGVVQVSRRGQVAELHPAERITVSPGDGALQKEPLADHLHDAYRTGEFVCDHTPLWKLVAVLNEAYGSRIVIARPQLRSLPLTTTFRHQSLDTILDIIAQTLELEVVRKDDQIFLQ
ncbi:FecR domain-containing protein [Paraflavisolibacter sp. H34]|uniref:FecR family protein n=1 Tax=Huijunlia imazamoxiresistens TaxID=3127457 RepID=UPI00301591D8